MSLHPDERPKDVLEFRDALIGRHESPERIEKRTSFDVPTLSIFSQEQIAVTIGLGLFLIGLVATLVR